MNLRGLHDPADFINVAWVEGRVMSRSLSVVRPEANSVAAVSCQQRQLLAEPLWFALMCREIWGPNAAKDLQFILDRSERTCRAWASGDSEPSAGVIVALLFTDQGRTILDYLMREFPQLWWLALMRAERIVTAEDQIDRS